MMIIHNAMSRINTSKLISYATMGFLIGSVIMWGTWTLLQLQTPPDNPVIQVFPSTLQRFTSYEHLKNFIEIKAQEGPRFYYPGLRGKGFAVPEMATMDAATAASNGGFDYSTTNIQVEGVDEADLVKTDGRCIYLVAEDTVHIIRAYPPEEARLVSSIELDGWVLNIYVNGDKLVVIQAEDPYVHRPWPVPEELWGEVTKVHVYDISDRVSPPLDRTVTSDGYLLDSRMIGDHVYVVTQRTNLIYNDSDVWLPRFKSGDQVMEVEADMIYYANMTDCWYSFTNVLAVNVQDPDEPIGYETFLLGSSSTLYASRENIYLAAPSWDETDPMGGEVTRIFKVTVDGRKIEYTADGRVPGRVLNQFSMDEHDGYFRIATQSGRATRTGGYTTSNDVYVLNASLGVVGSLTGLAPGENLHSARFMGDRCYLVTFKKVDPLFTIDLSDPEDPEVLGKLKIPGYSDYLHPYDEDILIGIGKETVEAEEGDFAWYQGVKISLFDVSDVENPRELAKIEIGNRGSDTAALHDHKAVLFSRERNLLVIPILVAEVDPDDYAGQPPDNAYGEYVYQGAYVFHISPEDGIQVRGRVSHIDDPDVYLKSGYYLDSDLTVERSLYIEDTLYTLSQGMVKMNALGDLTAVGEVQLP